MQRLKYPTHLIVILFSLLSLNLKGNIFFFFWDNGINENFLLGCKRQCFLILNDRKNRGSKAVVLIVEVIILQPAVVFILNKTNSLGWDEQY